MSSPPLNIECGSAPTWPSVGRGEKWAIHAIPWGFHHSPPPSHLFSPIDQGVSLGVILPQRHLWSPGHGNLALSKWCGSTPCNTQDTPQRVTPHNSSTGWGSPNMDGWTLIVFNDLGLCKMNAALAHLQRERAKSLSP